MTRIPFEQISFAVVDDNIHIRRLVRTMLYSFGAREIFEAEDGVSGLELVEMNSPDIIILDLIMPLFDGFDFIRTVRNPKSCKTPRVPIIMLTGFAEKTNVIKARDLGVNEFMCKPFSADTLFKRIQSIVECPREFVETSDYFGPAWREPLVNGKRRRYDPQIDMSSAVGDDPIMDKLEYFDESTEVEL